jgi:hypothetical protein
MNVGEHALLDEFLAHWRAIPRHGMIPALRDFLDRPNPRTQPWTLIFDMGEPPLRTRLFGSMLAGLVGADLTGTDHLALFPPSARDDFLRRHRQVVARPCAMFSHARGATLQGRELSMAGVAVPLRRDSGAMCVARVIKVVANLPAGDAMARVVPHPPAARWIDLGAGVPE